MTAARRAGRVKRSAGWAALILAAAVVPHVTTGALQALCATALVLAIAAVGVNLIVGVAGQVSVAGAALMAVGALSLQLFTVVLDVPFPLPLLLAGTLTAAVGAALTMPALRFKGLNFILCTLALHFIVLFVVTDVQNRTVGPVGFAVDPPTIAGTTLETPVQWFYANGVVLIGVYALAQFLIRSRLGRTWLALREAPLAAAGLGIRAGRYTLLAFTASSFIIGVAGALFAYNLRVTTQSSFSFDVAIQQLAAVVIGGLGSTAGAVIGAVFLSLLPELIRRLVEVLPGWFPAQGAIADNVYAVDAALVGLVMVLVITKLPGGFHEALSRFRLRPLGLLLRIRNRGRRERADGGRHRPQRLSEPLLRCEGLRVTYGGASAIEDVTVEVGAGEAVVMLGVNGAGKTTTARAFGGFLESELARIVGGSIQLGDRDLRGLAPHQVARMGVATIPENAKVFTGLTVDENLKLAEHHAPNGQSRETMYEAFPALAARKKTAASLLSGGERQMLGLARALLLAPRAIIADELSLGVAPKVVADVAAILAERRNDGAAVLVIDHSDLALNLADFAYVLENGHVITQGTPNELVRSEGFKARYMGLA